MSAFIAYPSKPEIIGETIEAAVELLAAGNEIKTWRETDVVGRFISTEILQKIDAIDWFCADISVLNLNVAYEIGYAIGAKKRIFLISNQAVQEGKKEIEEIVRSKLS